MIYLLSTIIMESLLFTTIMFLRSSWKHLHFFPSWKSLQQLSFSFVTLISLLVSFISSFSRTSRTYLRWLLWRITIFEPNNPSSTRQPCYVLLKATSFIWNSLLQDSLAMGAYILEPNKINPSSTQNPLVTLKYQFLSCEAFCKLFSISFSLHTVFYNCSSNSLHQFE